MRYNEDAGGASRMPWGKYRGVVLRQVPSGYLGWALDEANLDAALQRSICTELARRIRLTIEPVAPEPKRLPAPDVLRAVDDVIALGFRQLALRHHPDRGGDHVDMIVATQARDWLRQAMGAA